MQFGILANEHSWYARDLARAAADRGHEAFPIDFRTLCCDVSDSAGVTGCAWSGETLRLNEFGCIIVRTMPPGSLEQVVYRMDALASLERAGTRVVNSPRCIECAVDKYLTTARLAEASLPVPRTVVCESVARAMDAFSVLNDDVVVKPLFGAEGRGIVRLTDAETAFRVFKSLARTQQVLYLQEYVNHGGGDVRIVVLNNAPLAAMRRRATLDFRANVAQSGTASAHVASDEEVDLALRAAGVTGAFIAGVDLVCDDAGRLSVLEVNAVPGWRALTKVTGVDVAARVIESLETIREN